MVVLFDLDEASIQEILCFVAGKCCQEVAAQKVHGMEEVLEIVGHHSPHQEQQPPQPINGAASHNIKIPAGSPCDPPAKIPPHQANRLLENINRVIEKNLDNDKFRVKDLAKELNYCAMQLTRIFKQIIRQTPGDYIHHFRLQRSRVLLESDSFSVKEVAYKVGFGSLEYFSRSFAKCYGECPSSFRRRIRSENP